MFYLFRCSAVGCIYIYNFDIFLMNWPFLFLVTIFYLKSILSFVYHFHEIHFPSLHFHSVCDLNLKWITCRQHIVRSFVFIISDTSNNLTGVFNTSMLPIINKEGILLALCQFILSFPPLFLFLLSLCFVSCVVMVFDSFLFFLFFRIYISFHSLLNCKVCAEKSADGFMGESLDMMGLFCCYYKLFLFAFDFQKFYVSL